MSAQTIFTLVTFNKENSPLIVSILIGLVIIIYVYLIFWFFRDIKARISSKTLKKLLYALILAIILPSTFLFFALDKVFVIFNIITFIVIFLYLILRPKTIEEVSNDQIYSKSEIVLLDTNLIHCKDCKTLNRKEFKFCINCSQSLVFECKNCKESVDPVWNFCPNCKTELHEINKRKIAFNPEIIRNFIRFIYTKGKLMLNGIKEKFQKKIIIKPNLVLNEKSINPSFELKATPEEIKQTINQSNQTHKRKKKKKKKKRY